MNSKYVIHPCETEQQMSDVAKLRYRAYKNADAIGENAKAEFRDKYDLMANTKTCIVYEENKPITSVRACVYSREHNFLHLPGFEVYKDEIEKEVGLDKIIVEANRYVIDPEKVDSKQLFMVPYRFIILNLLKFKGDYVMAAVRPNHVPLYRRFLTFEPISRPKKYPGINVEMIMMAADCVRLQAVIDKKEIFSITEEEVNNYRFNTRA